MKKFLEMLGINELSESKQDELKETLQTVIESKASEIAESKVEELLKEKKEELVEHYEDKFDKYKDDITSKFSNFVDSVIDNEMVIPESVIKYAHLGELYEGLIEQFKVRLAIDEGMIDEEVKDMLKEAKDEISGLRSELDESKGKILDYEKDTSEMAAHIYLRRKCDGLTESQSNHMISMLGDEVIKENIDKKFDIILKTSTLLEDKDGDGDKDKDGDGDKDKDGDKSDLKEMECPECGETSSIKEGDDNKCPECGAKMGAVKEKSDKDDDDDKKKVDEGKGKAIVNALDESVKKDLSENAQPWEVYKNMWLGMMKS